MGLEDGTSNFIIKSSTKNLLELDKKSGTTKINGSIKIENTLKLGVSSILEVGSIR